MSSANSHRRYGSHELDKHIINHYAKNKNLATNKRYSYTGKDGEKQFSPTLSAARKALAGVQKPSQSVTSTKVAKPTPVKQKSFVKKADAVQVILATDAQGREYAVNLTTHKIAAF